MTTDVREYEYDMYICEGRPITIILFMFCCYNGDHSEKVVSRERGCEAGAYDQITGIDEYRRRGRKVEFWVLTWMFVKTLTIC